MAGREIFDVAVMGHGVSLDCGAALRQGDPEIALVMLSESYSPDAAMAAVRMGAAGLITQPAAESDLQAAVDDGVRQRQAVRAIRTTTVRWRREIEEQTARVAVAFAALDDVSTVALAAQFKALSRNGRELFDHGARTAVTAFAIAEGLRCDDEEAAAIGWGALLHDVGKLALPAALLSKPSPLSDAEAAIVRAHPQIGAEILRGVALFVPAAEIVLASHERYDGKGYPRGLRGAGIPLGARITMVADTIDVMVHGRSYQEPVSSAQTAAELVRGAGSQFDPDIVQQWLRVAERIGVAV